MDTFGRVDNLVNRVAPEEGERGFGKHGNRGGFDRPDEGEFPTLPQDSAQEGAAL